MPDPVSDSTPASAAHPFTPKVDVPSVCSVCDHTLGTDVHQPATAAKRAVAPFQGYADDEVPAWLDVGTLRFERGEAMGKGFLIGMFVGLAIAAFAWLIGALLW